MKLQKALELVALTTQSLLKDGGVPTAMVDTDKADNTEAVAEAMFQLGKASNIVDDLAMTIKKGATLLSDDHERLDALKFVWAITQTTYDKSLTNGVSPKGLAIMAKNIAIVMNMIEEVSAIIDHPQKKVDYAQDFIIEQFEMKKKEG